MKGGLPLLAALALLAAACSQQAAASYDPLASGTVSLALQRSFAAHLRANGIALSASAPAKEQGRKLILPVSGGEWDPTTGKGTAETEGAFYFKSSHKKLPFREITLKAHTTPLYAKVGGGQLKVASSKTLTPTRSGFGAKLSATGLALSAKVATRLNKKLRPKTPFRAGQLIGTLSAKFNPETIAVLPQGRAYLAPSPAILAKLDSLHVSLNPIAPAELAPGPILSFPLAGKSRIAPDASAGTLRSAGQLEFLQLGAGQVFWAEQWLDLSSHAGLAEVDLQPSPPYAGKQGQLGILTLGRGVASQDPKARTVAVSGAPLALTAPSAAAFNQAFASGKAAFAAGEAFGTVSFVAQGQ